MVIVNLMRVKKFALSNDSKKFHGLNSVEEFYLDTMFPEEAKKININLIEIQTDENPSDIILIIKKKEVQQFLPLYLFKTEMLFVNGRYCWNTSGKKEFSFEGLEFSLNVEGGLKKFVIDFYYSTDQQKPYVLFEKDRNRPWS